MRPSPLSESGSTAERVQRTTLSGHGSPDATPSVNGFVVSAPRPAPRSLASAGLAARPARPRPTAAVPPSRIERRLTVGGASDTRTSLAGYFSCMQHYG